MKQNLTYRIKALIWILGLILTAFIVSEIWISFASPIEEDIEELAAESVGKAVKVFERFVSEFREEGGMFSSKVEGSIRDENSFENLNASLPDLDLWGASVSKKDSLLFWKGFVPELNPDFDTDDSLTNDFIATLKIDQNQNVTFIEYVKSTSQASDSSHIIRLFKKLEQKNVLNLGKNTEISFYESLGLETKFPVHFSINDDLADNIIFESDLVVGNSVVKVFSSYGDVDSYNLDRDIMNSELRLAFIISFFIVALILLILLKSHFSPTHYFLIALCSVITGWILLWVLFPFLKIDLILEVNTIQNELFYLCLNAFLGISLSILISDFYYSLKRPEKKIPPVYSYSISIVYGLLVAIVFSAISISLYKFSAETPINLNDLNLIPDSGVLMFYLFSGLIWISSGWFFVYLCILLFQSIEKRSYLTLFSLIIGFSIGCFFVITFSEVDGNWFIITSALLFGFLSSLAYLAWKKIINLRSKSRLRLMLWACLFASALSYTPFYFGQIEWQEDTMLREARAFAQENDLEIENITIEALLRIEQQLSGLEISNVSLQKNLLNSAFLNEINDLTVQHPDWQSFSFSIQLVDTLGNSISEFTTNLNAPGWTKAFDTFTLEIPFEQERIRRDRLRPIIRQTPIENSEVRYTSYRQGWIPFYTSPTEEEKLGWIICSIYQEEPQYRKPLRAVIASKEQTDESSTFLLNEFNNRELVHSSIIGRPIEIPSYSVLPDAIIEELKSDSIITKVSEINGSSVFELFWAESPNHIIKTSTLETSLFNHGFSVLRFFFYLVAGVFLFSLGLQYSGKLHILGYNKRFKDRLIDRFILASLLCLIVLIGATSFAITNQTEEVIREDLKSKLIGVSSAFNNSDVTDLTQVLNTISNLTNSDAVLYQEERMVASTAPQIFSQNLLPQLLPWPIYSSIQNNKNSLEFESFFFDDEEFLIGYTPIYKDGVIRNVVAIPTFLKTPTFSEQLLTTISYLVGLLVVIFGIFIFAASVIANRLTSPLEELNEGIQSISDGSLETTLPVKSNDEIGALTNTFNMMVIRLQELRKDLIEAEREEAWKEMAQQVAHEIKNPLTPMKLNLQHLDRQIKTKEISMDELRKKVSSINKNMIDQIEALSKIASDFSKFARPMEQDLLKIDVNEVLRTVIDLYSKNESVSIKTNLNKNPLWILGVKEELQRAFINLVKNGIEAIHEKGTVTITSSHSNYKAHIEISDTGEGIPDNHNRSIFVPNFSTKSSGTGLGLAITKKIIEEHNGSISYTSEIGKGTTFKLSFDLFSGKDPN